MSTEVKQIIQGYGLSRTESSAVLTQAIIDMRNGGITAPEATAVIGAVEAQTHRMQTVINAMAIQLKMKQSGVDFGEYLKNAKMIVDIGEDI